MLVAFTGTLATMKRKDAEKAASSLGWHVGKKITKQTTAVIVGKMDNSRLHGEDSEKLKKAKAQGMRMISEAEFLSIVE